MKMQRLRRHIHWVSEFWPSRFNNFGLIAVMVMAALGVQNGVLTVGDFVMVNAYMIQITMPLISLVLCTEK